MLSVRKEMDRMETGFCLYRLEPPRKILDRPIYTVASSSTNNHSIAMIVFLLNIAIGFSESDFYKGTNLAIR